MNDIEAGGELVKHTSEFDEKIEAAAARFGADAVVELWKKRTTTQCRITSDVLEYWEELRVGQSLPRRSDIVAARLGAALPFTFLLERIVPGIARIRVAGQHLSDLLGDDARGMPISAFCASGTKTRFLDLMDQVFDMPCSLSLDLVNKTSVFGPSAAEMLILPLRDESNQITCALGCLVARGRAASLPQRFEISEIHQTRLSRTVNPVPLHTTAQEKTDADWQPTSVPWLKIVR